MMPKLHFKIPAESSEPRLAHWFQKPLGKRLFVVEMRLLNRWMANMFGYHCVQVGALGQHILALDNSRLKSLYVMSTELKAHQGVNWVQTNPLELPIASHSIDVILLAHSLDFSDHPHQLLREVERILIPSGRVIILGFNPFSSWGLRRFFSQRKQIPWTSHFISRHRTVDWLALLGFEVERSEGLFFRPPVHNAFFYKYLPSFIRPSKNFLGFFSGVYAIQAVKREFTLTPIDPAWKLSADFIGNQIIKPAMGSVMMSERVVIYTDGACKGNPGPGGWGALMLYKGHEKEVCGGESDTTNNRMEIMAVIGALTELKKTSRLEIITDSQYVKNGINQWIHNWKRNGWMTAARKPVKNSDLWKRLDSLVAQHDVQWKWVKGHSGDSGNDRADQLANDGISQGK